MSSEKDLERLKRLVLRHGTPVAPSVDVLVTELRSQGVPDVPQPPEDDRSYALGIVVIEWTFTVPWTRMEEFNKFLLDNEKLIADGCEKLMEGVHYGGTFLSLSSENGAYRTFWRYDTAEAIDAWQVGLDDRDSNFYNAMKQLRGYWASDEGASECQLALACLYSDLTSTEASAPFLALTIAAAEGS